MISRKIHIILGSNNVSVTILMNFTAMIPQQIISMYSTNDMIQISAGVQIVQLNTIDNIIMFIIVFAFSSHLQ